MGVLLALYAFLRVVGYVGRKLAPVLLLFGLVVLITVLYKFMASSVF